jgi:hypothetical protein
MKRSILITLLLAFVLTLNNAVLLGGPKKHKRPEPVVTNWEMALRCARIGFGGGLALLLTTHPWFSVALAGEMSGLAIAVKPWQERDAKKQIRLWRTVIGCSLLMFGIYNYDLSWISFPSVATGGCLTLWPWIKKKVNNFGNWAGENIVGNDEE